MSSRVLFAAAVGAVLAAVVVVVVLFGGDEGPEPADPDVACVQAWNEDEAALAYGPTTSTSITTRRLVSST